MKLSPLFPILFMGFWLGGCAAVGVVATLDPLLKLNDAEVLFQSKDRPLPAEALIQEASAIYRQREDWHGLGHAYRDYGDLLKSESVTKWEYVYRRDGFKDKTITYDNRLEKANDFYRLALDSYAHAETGEVQSSRYDALTNLYFNIGVVHHHLNEDVAACAYFGKSLEASERNREVNPSLAPPANVVSQVIAKARTDSKCAEEPPNKSLQRAVDP